MDSSLKKRLGQYFSGEKVASLLIELSNLSTNDYIIDPMAGSGDMLKAAIKFGLSSKNIYGIEIDPVAASKLEAIIKPEKLYVGDAFSEDPYAKFDRKSWDLVITNPPYVRYQSLGSLESDTINLQSSKEIRNSLSRIISNLKHLDSNEKEFYKNLTRHYSGLSDLAVPAWILCAALTQVGGKLAIVVPESWITREYALIIKLMLYKLFTIEYIVEDINSVWFPGVLVKTNLVIARRVELRDDFNEIGSKPYTHIKLGSSLIGNNSLVDKLKYDGKTGTTALYSILDSNAVYSSDGIDILQVPQSHFLSGLTSPELYRSLLKKIDPHMNSKFSITIPNELQKIFGVDIKVSKLGSFETWGFFVGQGLRTGANKFFYATLVRSDESVEHLRTDDIFGKKTIPVNKKYSRPSLRYQKDLGDGYTINENSLSHRLLYIQEALDIKPLNSSHISNVPLIEHINVAENISVLINGKMKKIPDLSAVKPNIRKATNDYQERQWYMLPALSDRHTPQLCISRINNNNPVCYLIEDTGLIVDANFSTIWTIEEDKHKLYALFALMNSTWVQINLETISTIMGGGALKVEASHIKKILLPLPSKKLISELSVLGKNLVKCSIRDSKKIISEIDAVVLESILGDQYENSIRDKLHEHLKAKINSRKRK